MSNILGINHYFHDSSACLVSDGKLVAAIEEERLTLRKHSREFPALAVDRCLDFASIAPRDIDYVAVSINPTHNLAKKTAYAMKNPRHAPVIYDHEINHAIRRQRELKAWHRRFFADVKKPPPIAYVEHHLAHVAGSFFVSPYEEAALLGMDGSGEWATTWIGQGRGNEVKCLGQSYFPHSLGSFYEAVTQFCGFKTNYDEGKTMGLAPLGDPERFYPAVSKLVNITETGEVRLDLSYFNFQFFSWNRLAPKFEKEFGQRRRPDEEFQSHHMDVAAAFQRVLEDSALKICDRLHRETGMSKLVVAGGVALNSVMNGRIVRESPFDDIYVMPAAGDNGTSIGAAFYHLNSRLGKPRDYVHLDPFIGTGYSNDEIGKMLDTAKLDYTVSDNVARDAAEILAEGKIIGWFQGRMEFGPRSLGGRSILANPAIRSMKDKINAEVKFREAFRPFAPATTVARYQEYFDTEVEAPFMLKVCQVRPEYQDKLPAITHVDGSARVQTVRRETNAVFYDLIVELGKLSGYEVVLNTSFNIQGQPIVESPVEALKCFWSTGLDVLVIGNHIVKKRS